MSNSMQVLKPGARMSSREIAEVVESRHDKVKQSMERLENRGIIQLTPMGEVNHQGQRVEVYQVNKRDSYVVVAQLSPEFTARLVDRWQELEQQTAFAQLPNFQNPAAAARAWAEQVEGRAQAQQQLEQAKPAIQFAETVTASNQEMTIRDAAKVLNTGEIRLFQFLRSESVLMKNNTPYQRHIDNGWFTVRMSSYRHPTNGQTAYQKTMVTGKGLLAINRKLAALELSHRRKQRDDQLQMEVCV